MALRINPDHRWPFVINDDSEAGLPRNTFVLLALSVVSVLSVVFAPAGIVGLLLAVPAVIAWRRGKRDGCRRLTRAGWIAYAAVTALQIFVTLADVGTG